MVKMVCLWFGRKNKQDEDEADLKRKTIDTAYQGKLWPNSNNNNPNVWAPLIGPMIKLRNY